MVVKAPINRPNGWRAACWKVPLAFVGVVEASLLATPPSKRGSAMMPGGGLVSRRMHRDQRKRTAQPARISSSRLNGTGWVAQLSNAYVAASMTSPHVGQPGQ